VKYDTGFVIGINMVLCEFYLIWWSMKSLIDDLEELNWLNYVSRLMETF